MCVYIMAFGYWDITQSQYSFAQYSIGKETFTKRDLYRPVYMIKSHTHAKSPMYVQKETYIRSCI